ncbi:MAG: hypothetical protein EXR71_19265 [Myxococcales bacterium]|nr:hypothetical protein [Myxococcales bacterium]
MQRCARTASSATRTGRKRPEPEPAAHGTPCRDGRAWRRPLRAGRRPRRRRHRPPPPRRRRSPRSLPRRRYRRCCR